jgi:hypothetical protein
MTDPEPVAPPAPFTPEDFKGRVPAWNASNVQQDIDDVWAMVLEIAPCIADEDFDKMPVVIAIVRPVIERRAGVHKQDVAGPFQVTWETGGVPQGGGVFYPSEINALQKLCGKRTRGAAFEIDTLPVDHMTYAPLTGVVVNGDACLNGPPGEWSEEELPLSGWVDDGAVH